MPDEKDNSTITEPAQIELIEFHQPVLKDGDYAVTVTQTIEGAGLAQSFQTASRFNVAGERFSFGPELIHSVFPPEGSLGDHFNVLPHIILKRSTLAWERTADEAREDVPWLALLVFDSEEAVKPTAATLADLVEKSGNNVKWRGIDFLESGQHEADNVVYIDVEKSLLDDLLPSLDELKWLAHVRQNGANTNDELAVVIANRLPRSGAISTAHLVSLEDRFTNGEFDFQNAAPTDSVRFVSLKSWSFACADRTQDFKGLLENLDPYFQDKNRNQLETTETFNVNNAQRERAALRIPPPENASDEAKKYLSDGFVPLPHGLREGDKTVSWYHSPLIPGENSGRRLDSAVCAADELVRYNPDLGMFDVSYAAAWELGRLLALQNKKLSVSLYQWKRANVRRIKQAEQQILCDHLPPLGQNSDAVDLTDDIASWFDALSLLQGVPFNYLVPDERMLPTESIRFFTLDQMWIDCLLDGAFSIGRVTTSDYLNDRQFSLPQLNDPKDKISGCLLRSNVVSGWTDLQVDAYDAVYNIDPANGGNRLNLLRMDRLSPNILLCLFGGGTLRRIEVHQKPESLHFGFDFHEELPLSFYKNLRNNDGEELDGADGNPVEFEIDDSSTIWRQQEKRVLDIDRLAGNIQHKLAPFITAAPFTSAQFALQMIEGVEKVVFQVQN